MTEALNFQPLTPLERLLDDHHTAFLIRYWYASAEWERRVKAELHEQANSAHRSVGQLYRHAVRRLRAAHFQEQR